jgi:UDP-N-acetylglucosamine 2-epimerase (non-hydrolysing)
VIPQAPAIPVRVIASLGTRPEAIKLAPVALAAREHAGVELCVLSLGQHEDICDEVMRFFGVRIDFRFNVMRRGQSLAALSARCLLALEGALAAQSPDLLLVQGDTSSAAMAALAAFYAGVPVWHVEAGLRTSTPRIPFPEEMNRRLIARLASFHFAPTETARANLLAEGVDDREILVTGNTGIDALHAALARRLRFRDLHLAQFVDPHLRLLLVTMHRRENWGRPIRDVCETIRSLVSRHQELQVVFAAHPNPRVQHDVSAALGSHPRILLAQPIDYGDFALLLSKASIVLTDSGGIQEEAPSLGVAVLVARVESERTEGLAAGLAQLVGTDETSICNSVAALLAAPSRSEPVSNPYGDGAAAARVVEKIGTSLRPRTGLGPDGARSHATPEAALATSGEPWEG